MSLADRLNENLAQVEKAAKTDPTLAAASREQILAETIAFTLAQEQTNDFTPLFAGKAATFDENEMPLAPGAVATYHAEKVAGGTEEIVESGTPDAVTYLGQQGGPRVITKGSQIFAESGLPIADTLGADRREKNVAIRRAAMLKAAQAPESFEPTLTHREASEEFYRQSTEGRNILEVN